MSPNKSAAIRPLRAADYDQWLPLWNANNLGHADAPVTRETWRRLMDPDFPIYGIGAFPNDRLAGFVHAIVHPVTGHLSSVCYMQDLFVDPSQRQGGIGRALVLALADWAKSERFARLYWLAEGQNAAAQALYASIGVKLDFTFHVLPL